MKTIELTYEEAAMLKKDCTTRINSCEEYLKSGNDFLPRDWVEYELRLSKSILEKL